MPEPERWTIAEVAAYLGAASTGSARRTLSRWHVKAVEYQPGPGGRPQALYEAAEVRTAHSGRPGRGTRSDLKPPIAGQDTHE